MEGGMAGKRTALLIVTDTHADPSFRALRAPQADAEALAAVLSDPEIGGFTVETLVNRPSSEVRARLYRLLTKEAGRDDMVLCYVSGHGIKDAPGKLYLVTTDTERDSLPVSALAATDVRDFIDHSPARRTVLWLDCCYSGAFPAGRSAKSGDTVEVVEQLTADSGRGCSVMTASTAIQYSFEGNADPQATGVVPPSVFTDAIVRGLRTGAADLNSDGYVDAGELYQYVYDEVKRSTPEQTPTRNDQVVGDLHIAYSSRGLRLDPALPEGIRQGLRSSMPWMRRAAFEQLTALAEAAEDLALRTLQHLAQHSDNELADAARLFLAPLTPAPEPEWPTIEPGLATRSAAREKTVQPLSLPTGVDSKMNQMPLRTFGLLVSAGGVAGGVDLMLMAGWLGIPVVAAGAALCALVVRPFLRRSRITAQDTSATLSRKAVTVNSVAFSPDGSALFAADYSSVRSWSTDKWHDRPSVPLKRRSKQVLVNPAGDLVACATTAGVWVWRMDNWRQVAEIAAARKSTVAFSPDGAYFVTAPDKEAATLRRTSDWQQVAQTTSAKPDTLSSGVAYSPDGALIAMGWGTSVLVWSPLDGEVRVIRTGAHGPRFSSVMFSPDGALLAAGANNGVTYVWCIEDWSVRHRLRSHRTIVNAVTFSPDGSTIATTDRHRQIQLWDVADGSLVRTLTGHFGSVQSIAFSPDGSVLASGSGDGMVKLWDMTRLP
jgi:sugar lactone lactonase YvrE